jgi:hypothetical protein
MFCQNCGNKLEDGTKFCTNCGAPQNDTPNSNPQSVPVEPAQSAPQPQQTPVEPVQSVPQPQQTPVNPTQNAPQPQQAPFDPAQGVPQPQQVPVNGQPFQYGEQPQYNGAPAPVANKNSFIDKLKKVNPKIYIFGGIAVLLVIAIIVVTINIVNNSGINGVLNHMEDAINDKDIDELEKCYPDFVWEEMDVDSDDIASALSISDDIVDISFSVEEETDVTDEDYSSSQTWQEYVQDYYEYFDDYDDEDVEKVVEAEIKFEYDFGNGIANSLASSISDAADLSTTTMHFVKVDGSWYIFN